MDRSRYVVRHFCPSEAGLRDAHYCLTFHLHLQRITHQCHTLYLHLAFTRRNIEYQRTRQQVNPCARTRNKVLKRIRYHLIRQSGNQLQLTGLFVIGIIRRSTEDHCLVALRIGSREINRRHLVRRSHYRHLTDLHFFRELLISGHKTFVHLKTHIRGKDSHTFLTFRHHECLALDGYVYRRS